MKKAILPISAVVSLLIIVAGVQLYASRKAEENLKTLLSSLGVENFSYRDVDYSLFEGRTEVRDLLIESRGGRTRIERFVISKITETDLEFSMLGVRGEDEEFKKFEKSLRDLGYDRVEFNLHFSGSLYEDWKELVIRRFSLELPDAFSVELKLKLSGIDKNVLRSFLEIRDSDQAQPAKLAGVLSKIYLKEVYIKLRDQSLLNRLITKEAERRKTSPEEIKKDLIAKLEKSLVNGKSEFNKSLAESLKNLIGKGGAVVLEGKPKNPLGMDDLIVYILVGMQTGNFSQLIEKLNLSVRYEH